MSKKEPTTAADVNSADYKNLVDLLAVFSEAKLRLEEMNTELTREHISVVDELRKEYATLQCALTESEAAIELIVLKHPDWFSEKRSVKTPYGMVKVTRSTKLEVPNEEVTLLLIEQAETAGRIEKGRFVRQHTEPNLEALSAMTDAELAALRINRVKDESVKVTGAKLDLGKAVKTSAETEEAAA